MKKCFKCGIEKALTEYYVHKKMKDGHLNKCKDCTRNDVGMREKKLRKDNPDWVEQEKIRAREKYNRLGYKDRHKPTHEEKKELIKRYLKKYPEKRLAILATRLIKRNENEELHHWSYNQEHWKDVIPLHYQLHAKLHRYLEYDAKLFMYRRKDNNVLLDSKDVHLAYIEVIKDLV